MRSIMHDDRGSQHETVNGLVELFLVPETIVKTSLIEIIRDKSPFCLHLLLHRCGEILFGELRIVYFSLHSATAASHSHLGDPLCVILQLRARFHTLSRSRQRFVRDFYGETTTK